METDTLMNGILVSASYSILIQYIIVLNAHNVQYVQYAQLNLRYIAPICLLLSNQSVYSEITDTRSTNFCTVSSTIHRLCGHRQWQCAACSTADVVRACSFK